MRHGSSVSHLIVTLMKVGPRVICREAPGMTALSSFQLTKRLWSLRSQVNGWDHVSENPLLEAQN